MTTYQKMCDNDEMIVCDGCGRRAWMDAGWPPGRWIEAGQIEGEKRFRYCSWRCLRDSLGTGRRVAPVSNRAKRAHVYVL